MTSEPSINVFEVVTRDLDGLTDARGESTKALLISDTGITAEDVRVILGYQVRANLTEDECNAALYDLFADPIIERATHTESLLSSFEKPPDMAIQVGFKPGVTDNSAQAALDGLTTLFDHHSSAEIATTKTYAIWGVSPDHAQTIANALHNPMIERASISSSHECEEGVWPSLDFPRMPALPYVKPATVNLEVPDDELISISEKGLLALNLEEMKAIQSHYRDDEVRSAREGLGLPPSTPTDAELECLAQTWSEHCSHKIFAASIHHVDTTTGEDTTIDSLFKTHIMQPTLDIQKQVDWLLSIFHDNSGVIAWNEEWSLCIKAETHNSPSALDPYGGAITGIVGVNRDIVGTGLGARPIANTDVFCFGPPDYDKPLPDGLFHP